MELGGDAGPDQDQDDDGVHRLRSSSDPGQTQRQVDGPRRSRPAAPGGDEATVGEDVRHREQRDPGQALHATGHTIEFGM